MDKTTLIYSNLVIDSGHEIRTETKRVVGGWSVEFLLKRDGVLALWLLFRVSTLKNVQLKKFTLFAHRT